MNYFMLRTYDHAGFYETRLILMVISLAIAGYFFYYKRDRRFLVMFASGSFFFMAMEYIFLANGLRGPSYHFSLFGWQIPQLVGPILQGLAEGGACALLAFWFADLRSRQTKMRERLPFFALCAVTLILSFVVGSMAGNRPVSSTRPMFASSSILIVTTIIFLSLIVAWKKDALSALANFYGGLIVFAVLNYEPLHLTGARYIGVEVGEQIVRASTGPQTMMMMLSHVFEIAGGRLLYFVIPFLLGLVWLREKDDEKKRERYSTQHLQDLAQRGWRKKSKPFQREN